MYYYKYIYTHKYIHTYSSPDATACSSWTLFLKANSTRPCIHTLHGG